MDTDSFYMAITGKRIEDLVKPELRDEFEKERDKWFPSEDTKELITTKFNNKEYTFTRKEWDKRTPLLFKTEFTGDYMIALTSKMYKIGKNDNKCLKCDKVAEYGKDSDLECSYCEKHRDKY